MLCLKIAGLVANSVDPDEMLHSAASHLGLHCLLRPVSPNTYGKYGSLGEVTVLQDFLHVILSKACTVCLLCLPKMLRTPYLSKQCRRRSNGSWSAQFAIPSQYFRHLTWGSHQDFLKFQDKYGKDLLSGYFGNYCMMKDRFCHNVTQMMSWFSIPVVWSFMLKSSLGKVDFAC